MEEELQNKIKDLEDRIRTLEGKRIFQQDIMPDVVKMRHVGEGIRFLRSGLTADLPTAETPMQGSAIYYATDTNKFYVYNGTAWKYVSLGGHDITAFDGLSKITVGTTQPTAPSQGDLWVDVS